MPQSEMPKPPQDTFTEQPAILRYRFNTAWTRANLQRDQQANEEARLGTKPPPIVRGRLWSKRRGEVSELAFFYKAASLGFGVAKPWGR
jgi:hypothetical protein